jgi:hypothetical protein
MKAAKKLVALATAVIMLGNPIKGQALDQYQEYAGGAGYIESRAAPSLAPAIALGAIVLVAIVAVAVQNANNTHGHCGH